MDFIQGNAPRSRYDKFTSLASMPAEFSGDSDRVAFLFALYQQIVSPLVSKKAARRRI
jgi:hypothetical protein